MMPFCGWVDGLRQPENAGCGGLHVLLVFQPAHLVFGGDFSGEPCAVFFSCPKVIKREGVGVVCAVGEADKAVVVVDVVEAA